MSPKPFTSFIVDSVEKWLANLPPNMVTTTKQEAQLVINHVTETLGYGEPFDREQKAINALLVAKGTNKTACQVVWDFYHEIRFADFSDNQWKQKSECSTPDFSLDIPPL